MVRTKRPVSWNVRVLFEIIPALILLWLLFWYIDAKAYPAVESIAGHQARGYAAEIINTAMKQELNENELSYGDIISLAYNTGGKIASVQTNISVVGRLQTGLAGRIIKQVEQQPSREAHIALGTLFGNPLLAGRGPRLNIKIIPIGSMETRLEHQFLSAGINQTLHRIMLVTQIDIQTLLPGRIITTNTSTGYCIAETVIVGEVPQGYTYISGDDSSMISKLNDYKAIE